MYNFQFKIQGHLNGSPNEKEQYCTVIYDPNYTVPIDKNYPPSKFLILISINLSPYQLVNLNTSPHLLILEILKDANENFKMRQAENSIEKYWNAEEDFK